MPVVPSIKDILADRNLTRDQKILLIAIREHAHADGTGAYPSLRRLCALASVSMSHLCTLLPTLETTGYLTIERFKGPKGVNAYSLHAKQEVLRSEEHPGEEHPGEEHPGEEHPGEEHPGEERAPQELLNAESEVQAEERKDPEVLFQAEEHLRTELRSEEYQDTKTPIVVVTEKAAHLVSTWVSPAFSQVLQGKDPDASLVPTAMPVVAAQESETHRRPRSVAFDESKFELGVPCEVDPTHRYGNTGQTVRSLKTQQCEHCRLADKKMARRVIDLAAHREQAHG